MHFSQGSPHFLLHRLCSQRYWQRSWQGGHEEAQFTLQLCHKINFKLNPIKNLFKKITYDRKLGSVRISLHRICGCGR